MNVRVHMRGECGCEDVYECGEVRACMCACVCLHVCVVSVNVCICQRICGYVSECMSMSANM